VSSEPLIPDAMVHSAALFDEMIEGRLSDGEVVDEIRTRCLQHR